MEYNKTKRGLEKAAAITGIVMSSICLIVAVVLVIVGINYLMQGSNHYINGVLVSNDYQNIGTAYLVAGLYVIVVSILLLIFCIKLVKSPFKPNGELKKLQPIRIWVLVLSIISGNLVVMGLMIAVLCLKDYKQPKQQVNQLNVNNQEKYIEFYNKIQEVNRLKSLNIIDAEASKKAIAKIVLDITKE